jgi:hypothetical protein
LYPCFDIDRNRDFLYISRMKRFILLSFFISGIILTVFSALKNNTLVRPFSVLQKDQSELYGCWSFIEFKDGFHWEKTDKIKAGNIGYEFKSDGTLFKRHPKNRWEDPAVTFEDYKGTWKMLSADMIEMYYDFGDGRKVRESVFINIFKEDKMVWQRLSWEEQ